MRVTLAEGQKSEVGSNAWDGGTNATTLLYERTSNRRAWDCVGAGGVSIKCFFAGEAHYEMDDGGRARLDEETYLLLNAGQPYQVHRPYTPRAESLLLSFSPDLAARVWRDLVTGDTALLDSPHASPAAPPSLTPRCYSYADDSLSRRLRAVRDRCRTGDSTREDWEEHFHDLLRALYAVHLDARREMANLPAVRAATREELYRRLYIARDYIAACYDRPLTLTEIGRASALSETHLLRTFGPLFGETPHAYLTRCRLDHACRLLRSTDLPVTTICQSVGFTSIGAFGTLFRRRTGLSPVHYRRGAGKVGDFEEAETPAVVPE